MKLPYPYHQFKNDTERRKALNMLVVCLTVICVVPSDLSIAELLVWIKTILAAFR